MNNLRCTLTSQLRALLQGLGLSLACAPAFFGAPAQAAQISGAAMSSYASGPVTTVSQVTPLVMLAMSRDHQYFFKAYNDFSDLEGDGDIEQTYDDTFTYYGYFHSELCYTYDDVDDRFEPTGATDGTANKHYCTGAQADKYSGNFLNWATMTRMDIVRKILYGGQRSSDTATLTVLERAHLPPDAHSFTKYYNGEDLKRLTPFESNPNVRTPLDGGTDDGYDNANEGITMCNTTYDSRAVFSHTTTRPPVVRIVYGNRQLWAANERWQCTWESERGDNVNGNNVVQSGLDLVSSDPPDSLRLLTPAGDQDHVVRVVVCDAATFDASNNLENCQQYPSGVRKPTGLLQRYGETGLVNFGLLTGSWNKNISGGALRKNIGNMADEINITTDGTFKATPAAGGIIGTLSTIRMYGYNYGTANSGNGHGTYFPTTENCGFQLAAITEGSCRSWGNPIGEIYLEALRYFAVSAGRAPTPAFDPNDTGTFAAMTDASWATDPLTLDNACASLNIIAFNASVNTYDDNATSSTILGGNTPQALTNTVGAGESINGNTYFIGRTAASTNEFCTQKLVANLGDAYGQCPESPTTLGSFHMAGLAHYARTHDLRSDLEGEQNIRTFGVQLATSVPNIEIPIGPVGTAQKVRVLPAYRLQFNNGSGALVDFKVVRNHTEVDPTDRSSPGTGLPNTTVDGIADIINGVPQVNFPVARPGTGLFHGKFYVNWEDSEQGGDYDQDMWGTIDYVVDTTVDPARITVTTKAVSQSTVNAQLFGFVISGTTQNGFHAYSGIRGANHTDAIAGVLGCTNCRAISEAVAAGQQRGAQSHTFTVSTSTAADLLENPLFYAAKWGGFNDFDDDDTPNLQREWDIRDQSGDITADANGDGVPDGDGIPDNYFFVSNPAKLEDALASVFDIIIERVSSGTAAAVVANDQEGTGAVFQALYDPIKSDNTAAQNEAQWIGTLHALFVDTLGFLREDNDQDGKLDGYDVDKVVEIFFDQDDRRSKIRRYDSDDALEFDPPTLNPDPLELTELQTVWNARKGLADLDASTIQNQRNYVTPVGNGANAGRHILTWADDNLNNIVAVDGSETVSFDTTTFASNNRIRWLDQDSATEANNLINWVRGKEVTGLRNRTVDYDGDNTGGVALTASGQPEVMRLGDIIHSTPIPLSTPIEAYDLLSLDTSYAAFRATYINRRQVIYVGGNDGMIHAFNGGFFDSTSKQFKLALSGEVAHPLGAELWAYIPKNLLPHLQWLARPDYTHVFYVDQTSRIFDAKIFTPDTTHPGGWGTVLVAGMRFGGGTDATKISIDVNLDGSIAANGAESMKSAYVVLDITDPEQPPKVLAELAPDTLNLTTSFPQIAVIGDAIEPGSASSVSDPNKWYLVFGSGPTQLGSASSTQTARLFAYNLRDLAAGRSALTTLDGARVTTGPFSGGFAATTDANSFVGDPLVTDFDIDMKAETLYFGTVGNAAGNAGGLWRLAIGEQDDPLNWGAPFKILDTNQPFLAQPSATLDNNFDPWVIAGTGRLFVNADKTSTTQQSLYGFVDPNPRVGSGFATSNLTVDPSALKNTTNVQVLTNGDVDEDRDGTTDGSFAEFAAEVEADGGWVRDYQTASPDPSERSINRSSLIDGVLFNTAFTPSTDLCTSEGSSRLLGLAFNTGTALPTPIFGTIPCPGCPEGVSESSAYVDLGAGLASTPSIHIGDQTIPGKVTVITQKSTGAIDTTDATTLGGIANGEISWREYRSE